jgi:hypothetical protein
MQKVKQNKKIIIFLTVVLLIAVFGYTQLTRKAGAIDSLLQARDTISDSDPAVSGVTHTIEFTTGTTTPVGGFWHIEIDSDFTNILQANVTCGWGALVASTSGNMVDCVVAGSDVAPTSTQVVITDVVNPAAESTVGELITIENRRATSTLDERAQVRVFIIEDVLMTASVDATLVFAITGTSSLVTVNGVTCTASTTATTTPFGTLSTVASSTVCQELFVTTNADYGYTVTVEQDNDLVSDASSTINAFNNSLDFTGSTTPQYWAAPQGILDSYHTYGHMGLTSNDETLNQALWTGNEDPFYASTSKPMYVGFNNRDPVQVMYHDGPADGITDGKGWSMVAYTAEITALQEAGDYESTLTYICTPTY